MGIAVELPFMGQSLLILILALKLSSFQSFMRWVSSLIDFTLNFKEPWKQICVESMKEQVTVY